MVERKLLFFLMKNSKLSTKECMIMKIFETSEKRKKNLRVKRVCP